jgi:hypothetical protein
MTGRINYDLHQATMSVSVYFPLMTYGPLGPHSIHDLRAPWTVAY